MSGGSDHPGYFRHALRHRFEYLGLRIVAFLLNLMPIDAASALMGTIWRLVAPHLRRHDRVLEHLRAAYPDESLAFRQKIALAMWRNLGRVFAESLMIERIVRAGRMDVRCAPLLEEVQASDKGVVFVSLHTGNWELAVMPAASFGLKVAGIYQKLKNPLVDSWLLSRRRPHYPRGLFPKGADVPRKILRLVREGGAITLLADLRDRRGIPVQFFGRPAPTSIFPAMIARGAGVPIVAGRVVRTQGVNFVVESRYIPVPRTDDRDADIEAATRAIHAQFEAWIRENPDQWMWGHRRWG